MQNYSVITAAFAERHYIKSFRKDYKHAWEITFKDVIKFAAGRIDVVLQTKKADLIIEKESYKVVKFDFAVDGTKMSPKTSGCRCIFVVNEEERSVEIVLVYKKTDIDMRGGETSSWKRMVRENYPEYRELCA